MDPDDRYVVISADGHAGAPIDTYRDYLPASLHDELETWRSGFQTPWADLKDLEAIEYRRNFDSDLRQAELEHEGVVGEVLYPNTVPPFAPSTGLHGRVPDVRDRHDLDLRWAGIHAHNQWLADFCAEAPGRRAGVAQLLFEDVDRAVDEVRWVADRGLLGGVLIPNPSPTSALHQLHAPTYEPIWATCAELGIAVHTHGGGGGPGYEDYGAFPASPVMMFVEFGWYGYRPLVRLLMSGVFERHPSLQFVMTEVGWFPEILQQLDFMVNQIKTAPANSVERRFAGPVAEELTLRPSEYWARQCHLGASLMTPAMAAQRHRVGLDRVMWGADYPHSEGTHPYTRQSYRHVFAGLEPTEVAAMLGGNAAELFDFDRHALREAADRVGPTVGDVATPLTAGDLPSGETTAMAFARPDPTG